MIDFNLDVALVIQLLVSTVLPLLVGLVTKTVTRPGRKAVLLAGLSLLTSLLVELGASITAGTTYDVGQGLLLALPTFLIAVGLHYGLWKPVGAAEKAQELFDPNTIVVHETPSSKLEPVVVNVYAESGNASEIASVVGEKLRRDFSGEV